MIYNIFCVQGRVGDKNHATLKGAKLTADLLEKRFGTQATFIGKASNTKNDTWECALPEAAPTLDTLQNELQISLEVPGTKILALNTCSASLATLPVVAAKYPGIKILWVDAHADFNTPETSETGYLGGMVLGGVCGLWESGYGRNVDPSQIVLIGAHDIDAEEQNILVRNHVDVIAPQKVSPATLREAVGDAMVWIHIDWDVLKPGQIDADYKVQGGLDLTQLITSFAVIPSAQILGLELAEFSPAEDAERNLKALNNILSVVDALLSE